jgi:hypothetical protein
MGLLAQLLLHFCPCQEYSVRYITRARFELSDVEIMTVASDGSKVDVF